ncbi:MAG: hypothetical protein ACREIS_00415 [Nitrospiraceae bacterium]
MLSRERTANDRSWHLSGIGMLLLTGVASLSLGCQPDQSPLKEENATLRKQAAKQESVIVSLQDGNKVMQQQIDLLNQELRDAKKDTERSEVERKALAAKLDAQTADNRKLVAESERQAAIKAQASQTIRVDEKGGQSEELPQSLAAVSKAVEEALVRNGYVVRVGVRTDQHAVYVTHRKVSAPASLEVAGFRNQYLVSLQALPTKGTRLSVKAEFEKMAQGNRILAAAPEETAEIERRLIAEIVKAAAAPGKI